MYTPYWNMTDEEVIKQAFDDPECSPLAHELAVRLMNTIDECKEAPQWAKDLVDGDDARR